MENQDQQRNAETQFRQTIMVVGKHKSTGVAFLLAFLFGPLGLLYSTVTGGIVMLIIGLIIGIVTLGIGLIFVWIASIIWAIIAVNNINKNINLPLHTVHTNQYTQPQTQAQFNRRSEEVPVNSQEPKVQSQAIINSENFADITTKSINSFTVWMTSNMKGLLIGAGSLVGLALLFLALKFLLSNDFNNEVKNQDNMGANVDTAVTSSTSIMADNQSIIDTYLGSIGNKEFKLFIENVDGDKVDGYNVTGTNRRPVKGRIVNKWTEPTGVAGNYTVYKLILSEPGNDKWDGEFNIDLYISDISRIGKGKWKAYNGKLEHSIIIKDRLNE